MREILKINKEFDLGEKIKEIVSISLEESYEVVSSLAYGEFLIDGTYKDDCDDLNDFNLKLPFDYKINKSVRESSVNINVLDFTYQLDSNILNVEVEYEIKGEETFDSEEEFNRFVSEEEVEVVELSDEEEQELNEYIEQVDTLEEESCLINENSNIEDENVESENQDREISDISYENMDEIKSNILNNVKTETEEEFTTYHVYICNEYDTLESISNKYKISKEVITEYNKDVKIASGVKIIIPFNE